MTAQIHEELDFEGLATSMASYPDFPEDHPRIVAGDVEEAIRQGAPEILSSTACWRGYLGTWKIEGGRLFLVGLQGGFKLRGDGPLFADWFTGVLIVPEGELLHYVHMAFLSVYEREVHVEIENGIVISSRVIENPDEGVDEAGFTL